MTLLRVLLFTCALTASAAALAEDARTLIMQAVEGASGKASGTLEGDQTEAYIRQVTGSKRPIRLDVETIATLRQPGCKRLRATFRLEDVLAKDGRVTPFWFANEFDVCPGGYPPVPIEGSGGKPLH